MLNSLVRPLAAAGLLACAVPALAQLPPPLRAVPAPVAVAIAPEAEQVVVELRVVCVGGEDGRAAVAKLFEAKDDTACCEAACCRKPAGAKTAFLTDTQLKTLLEQVAADRRVNVLQAPKVTLFDGQTIPVSILDTVKFTTGLDVKLVDGNPVMLPKEEKVELGTTFRISGALSADRKHVKLGLKYHDKRLANPDVPLVPVTTFLAPKGGADLVPVTQFLQKPEFRELALEQTASVPDGGTVVVHAGKQTVQVRSEFGPPVLSNIPYLNRLFKNVGIAEQECDVVVLATAKRVPPQTERKVVNVQLTEVPLWAPRMLRVAVSANGRAEVLPTAVQTLCVSQPNVLFARVSAWQPDAGDMMRPAPIVVRSAVRSAAVTPDLTVRSPMVSAAVFVPTAEPTDLLAAYRAACAAGDKDAAMRLAVQALAQDPTCFGRK